MQSRNREPDSKDKHVDAKAGKGDGRISWETENDIYMYY